MLLIAPEILGNPAATLVESEQKMEVCSSLFSCPLVSPSSLYRNGFAHFQNTFASRSKVCRFSNRCSKPAQILARGVGASCMSTTPHVHLPWISWIFILFACFFCPFFSCLSVDRPDSARSEDRDQIQLKHAKCSNWSWKCLAIVRRTVFWVRYWLFALQNSGLKSFFAFSH